MTSKKPVSFPENELPSPQVGISNTEVQQAYNCEQAWLFGFHPEMHYQLKSFGIARTRGILGHSALEIFYKGLKEERDYDQCAQEALQFIQDLRIKELMNDDFANPEMITLLNFLYTILGKYFEYYREDVENWEILDIEAFFATEFHGEVDFYLPSRLDLVVYHKHGEFAGETSPVDHKFVGDFWKKPKLLLNSQLPLYNKALRSARFAGKPKPVVNRAIINQIRTRALKNPTNEDLFQRATQSYSVKRTEKVFDNHMKTAVRLAYLKRLPLAEAHEEIQASLGSMACQYCDFKDLCDATFEGTDTSLIIEATLKPNEYGYPPLEEIRRERN